jgi:EAL domain-containing protein (putative c-di-GMP-specific phosphodiesterase class I)
VSGRDLHVTPSIGIAFSGTSSALDSDVLREADLAMYRAKEQGGARWEIYIDEMSSEAVARLDRELDLRRAVEDEEMALLFQPVIELSTGRVVGAEALVRWHHPERGVVSPAEFIPLAESTGLIVPLGRWVLREAMAQTRRWEDQGIDIGIAVNLSAVQFQHPGLVRAVTDALRSAEIQPSKLTLEITETVVMEDLDVAVAAMGDLGCLGVNFALDDFGQGYSSLGYLKAFPLKTVKIDRSFVQSLADSTEDQAIVRSVVSLSRELGMTVIAEGVETADQLDQVRRLGCDEVQGYFYAPPLRADDLARMVRTSNPVEVSVGAGQPLAG